MRLPEPNPKYRAWLLDLDGTLYAAFPVKCAMAIELLLTGWRVIPVLSCFRKTHEMLRTGEIPASLTSEVSPYSRQIEATAQRLGMDAATVERIVQSWMFARPAKWVQCFRNRKLLAAIAAFRAQGGKTALVSDYPARIKIAALGAAALFDAVVASGETESLRALKPAPEGYLLAATRIGVDPRDCLVIGDRDDADGEAARRAGMQFFQV